MCQALSQQARMLLRLAGPGFPLGESTLGLACDPVVVLLRQRLKVRGIMALWSEWSLAIQVVDNLS